MRDDDEVNEIFQGSRVDMEVNDVDQDDGYEDIDSGIGGRLHSYSNETGSQHKSNDDDESTVGRRGPVAPTPLPEPRNRKQIFIIHGEFSNQGKATRIIGETLQAFWSHPWTSWKDVSKEDENMMFDRFKFMKKKVKNLLSRARNSAKKAACNANVEVGDDLSVIIPYKPRWMGSQIWEKLVEYWNTDDWKARSSINAKRVKKRYGDDASKQPLFDLDSWIQAVGGRKKGRVYGFSDMSDPHVVMTVF
ncbi:hypothetical protein E3N88_38359 [Mikania micrantha]|uniref:Uncharacterized protein n=1 Tax=Mikania micrantha TaxID=192012 RepID=A0A5N6LWA9_9ASTR|nr:hypothetical protein E3N88_38359 [Mikania micrantha]